MLTREQEEKYYLAVVKVGYKETMDVWRETRLKAQTDLFFLATDILGYNLVDHTPDVGIPPGMSPHREICDLFVHKNPNESIANQSTIKMRLMMLPRGVFKTSCNEADVIQWVICFPDIRIILFTATDGLSVDFVNKIRSFFGVVGKDEKDRVYTKFQLLFPEHCVSADSRSKEGEFTTPARTKKITEPTIMALSIGANTSGYHAEVGKWDDAVSSANSGPQATEEQRRTVGESIRLSFSIIEPYGYIDLIGTPYNEDDAYAYQLAHTGADDMLVRIRSAWEVKKSALSKKPADLIEEDYHYLFPQDGAGKPRLTYGYLRKKQREDDYNFACQYLCKPSAARKTVNFTEQIIRSHITQPTGLPQTYTACCAWDFAYSIEDGRDYSVGTVGWFDGMGKMFVVDAVRGRFGKTDLAYQVAKLAAKWRAEKIRIEKSAGADFLDNDIRCQLIKLQYADVPIEWFPVDSTKGAKNSRAEMLETLLMSDRLWFSSEVSIMEDITKEFVRFKPGTKRKDDIVDSIAHLAGCMPPDTEIPKTEQERQERSWQILAEKGLHDLVYGVRENTLDPVDLRKLGGPPPEPPLTEFDGYPIGCPLCGQVKSHCLCG